MKLHPYSPNLFQLDFTAKRLGASLSLEFSWQGVLSLPAPHSELKGRAHELWKETCFEFFVKPTAGESYYEINLSPDGRWNSYVFSSYRSAPLSESEELVATGFCLKENGLQAEFKLGPHLAGETFKSNATAIINDFPAREKFWALAHSQSGAPDFHDRECFIYYLAP